MISLLKVLNFQVLVKACEVSATTQYQNPLITKTWPTLQNLKVIIKQVMKSSE
jgi:hypothetical protein